MSPPHSSDVYQDPPHGFFNLTRQRQVETLDEAAPDRDNSISYPTPKNSISRIKNQYYPAYFRSSVIYAAG